jgi:hypothetical protein
MDKNPPPLYPISYENSRAIIYKLRSSYMCYNYYAFAFKKDLLRVFISSKLI